METVSLPLSKVGSVILRPQWSHGGTPNGNYQTFIRIETQKNFPLYFSQIRKESHETINSLCFSNKNSNISQVIIRYAG
jgi:hypothetical protein